MAAFNVAISFHIGGFDPSVEQITEVNIFFASVIAFVSNVPEISVAAGVKAISRMNAKSTTGNPGTDLANTIANGDGIKVVANDHA